MNNEEFEKRYQEYLQKNKGNISYKLWEEKSKLDFNIKSFLQEGNLISKIQIPVFIVGGLVFSLIPIEEHLLLKIVSFVLWIGLMVWIWLSWENAKDAICNYVFNKYHRNRIIEEYVRRKVGETTQDKDIFGLWEEKYFYDKCIEQLKYENFEERRKK